MNQKLRQFVARFDELRIDAYLVTNEVNIRYLTGFPASESWLLVIRNKVFYITDFRYILEARKGLTGVSVKEFTKSIFETLFEIASEKKVKRLGFDDQFISLALFRKLKSRCPKRIALVARNNVVEQMREVKTAAEIKQIRKAIKLNLEAYAYLKRVVKPGLKEREVLLKVEQYVKSRGAGFSFDPIIASGPNSCYPHAQVSDRKIRNNEPVLIDMGIDVDGYKSDLTRMFFLGKISQLVRDVTTCVKTAQQKAIEKIKAGALASEVDDEARNYLNQRRLGRYFGHSLGHGVGLDIHEGPRISQTSSVILKEGMVFTVEPAVYLPNKFGVRIEDMVLVTKKGCEVLSGNINE